MQNAPPPPIARRLSRRRIVATVAVVVLALAAVGLTVWQVRGVTGSGSSQSHAALGGVSFDYPVGWHLTVVDHLLHYETVLGFLTTDAANASESCGPGYVPGMGGDCTDRYQLSANSAIVRVSLWDGPPELGGFLTRFQGWQMLTLAGQPAAYSGSPPPGFAIPDADETLVWAIAAPGTDDQVWYAFTANVRGPQIATIRSQLEATLATLKLSPLQP
jgi:hypothetical protein